MELIQKLLPIADFATFILLATRGMSLRIGNSVAQIREILHSTTSSLMQLWNQCDL